MTETNYAELALGTTAAQMPGEDPHLVRLYTLLTLVKGEATTLADVHDAWSLWRMVTRPDHPSLVPFLELDEGIQEYDRPYMDGIHAAARRLAESDEPVEATDD